jgi:hypothetical protein
MALANSAAAGEVPGRFPLTAVRFPPLGFDPLKQAVRVTVVNPSAVPSWAVVHFYTAEGYMVKHAPLSIGPRETAFLDLTGDDLCDVAGGLLIWTTVQSRDAGVCPGIELYDTATGATVLRHGDSRVVREGHARLIFPSVGVTSDQRARVTVVNVSTIVSRPVVVFLDAAGRTLKRTELKLPPRHVHSVAVSAGEFGDEAGRAQIRAEVFLGQPDPLPVLAVFDRADRAEITLRGAPPR